MYLVTLAKHGQVRGIVTVGGDANINVYLAQWRKLRYAVVIEWIEGGRNE
jgi:hypothetical protein